MGLDIARLLRSAELRASAVDAIYNAIVVQVGNRRERLRPMLRRHDSIGSTANIYFATRKQVDGQRAAHISQPPRLGKGNHFAGGEDDVQASGSRELNRRNIRQIESL